MNNLSNLVQEIKASLSNAKKNQLDSILSKFNFLPLSSGSARKVYANKDLNLVIKVSKNLKGIAQNQQETNLSNDYYISNEVNKVIEYFETNN